MTQLTERWQPCASLATLQQRAALFRTIRAFFEARDVLEVDTPLLSRCGVTDLHLENLVTRISRYPDQEFYLQTSPEYAMKRLLAAHGVSIYQLGKVFRDDEVGRFHNPEFTMLEWYRIGFQMPALIAEVVDLLHQVLGNYTVHQLTYQQAFLHYLTVDPLTATVAELQACLSQYEHVADLACRENDRDTLLQLALALIIEPQFDAKAITVISHFPTSQAALAQIDPHDERVALRFEVYVGGVELANGYQELTDATQQRARFTQDNHLRQQFGKTPKAPDERLLKALETGLPACSGVALGVDRLLMLQTGLDDIRHVLPFDVTCA